MSLQLSRLWKQNSDKMVHEEKKLQKKTQTLFWFPVKIINPQTYFTKH